ncbi:inner nuclear membrane protein Man1 [Anopheles nili]|uniref:inner nuclear membrane protein Man1 n=1 Tax=Anopheles nili TaxID=185578 RepID=UPI00237B5717|nr:inner nuclear membrane protein Man1 [Anopheles nili]
MDNLDQLADDELRLRLMQSGFPNLPVTYTTRNILIKKLRHHIESENQKMRRESSKAARYSSGEESDNNDGGPKATLAQRKITSSSSTRSARNQRATVGPTGGQPVSMPPPASVRPSVSRLTVSSISSPAASKQHNLSGNTFAGANGAGPNHHRFAVTTGNSNKKATLSPTGGSSIYISPLIVHDNEDEDYPSSLLRGGSGGGGAVGSGSLRSYGGGTTGTSASHSSLFRKTALSAGNITPPSANSSMYSNAGSSGAENNNSSGGSIMLNDSNGSNGTGTSGGTASTVDSPYVSEYTKRLMQLRGETVSHENFNSAIGGIIGRRSVNNAGGVAPATSPRYSAPTSQLHHLRPLAFHQQPVPAGGLLHHPLRTGGHPHLLNSKGMLGGVPGGSVPLGSPGSIIAGNHIRQRYSRLSGSNEFNENDIVTHAQPSPDPSSIPFRATIGNLIAKLDEDYGFKQTFIPCALLCLLVVFLVSVAFMYMTISTDLASTLNSIDTRYELCEHGGSQQDATKCVLPADVEPALELLKLIGNELKLRVERHHCRRDGDTAESGLMSAGEVLKYAKEYSPSVLIPQLTRHLHAMEYLIDRNPQWRINHCDAGGEPMTYEQVLEHRSAKTNHFTIFKPKLPFTCMIYNKFQKFFVIVGGLALTAIVVIVAKYFFKFVMHVKQRRRDQVNRLISEILHAVSQAAVNASDAAMTGKDTAASQAGVVINHLRDRLLGMDNRRRLGWVWNEALSFLEQHESRIAFEVGTIGGEDFKMMRWIDTAPLATVPGAAGPGSSGRLSGSPASPVSGPCTKKWQSPAFDNSNKIHDPPTPCLKIRQMFDKYEVNDPNLKTIVQDAILEKVGGRCKIYDIQLDRSSCCVYVRCASAKDAGIVHDEINGWWFDNRLVSIKFLRLERYLQRFPRSLSGPACLKPSNKNNSSMSHQLGLNNNGGPAGAGRRFSANGSKAGGGSRTMNEDLDTDPEEYEEGEGDGDEDEEEDEEDEEELMAVDARSGNNSRRNVGRRSGPLAEMRRRANGQDEHREDEQEDD